jgi:phage gpG-like protein
VNIRIRVTRDDLGKFTRRLGPQFMRQTLAEIGREFVSITQQNFGPSGIDRPTAWPPLSRNYQKRIKYFGPPLLLGLGGRRQVLRNSIHIENVFDNKVTVATGDLPYAAVHQFGGGNNIPARPYFPVIGGRNGSEAQLTPLAARKIQAVIDRRIEKAGQS